MKPWFSKARLVEALEHHVLLECEVEHEAVLVAVLGDVAHVLAAVADGGMGDILAAEGDRAGGRLIQACQAVDKLRLAVAVDTGDADDLSRANGERNVVHGVALVHVGVRRRGARPSEPRPRARPASFVTSSCTGRPTIMLDSSCLVGLARVRPCRCTCPCAERSRGRKPP